MPPQGGFPRIATVRHIPKKGFTGLTMLGLMAASVLGGVAIYVPRIQKESVEREKRAHERMQFLHMLAEERRRKVVEEVWLQAQKDAVAVDMVLKAHGAFPATKDDEAEE